MANTTATEQTLKEKMKEYYDSLERVYCKVLDEYVFFNSEGFNHLNYSSGRARTIKEAEYKLSLLPLAVMTIKKATVVDELRVEKIKIKGKEKEARFYALVSKVGKKNCKIKVILRKVGDGKLLFRSIMKLK